MEDSTFFSHMLNRGGDDGRVLPPPGSEPPSDLSSLRGVPSPDEVASRPSPAEGDLVLFKACRDRLPAETLKLLVKQNYCDINRGWYSLSDGSGWDVVGPMPSPEQKTSFYWPVGPHDPQPPKAKGSVVPPAFNASPGDTLLHIALKTRSKHVLAWLASDAGLDLNVVNDEGVTPAKCSEMEGCGSMYTFYFVLR